MRERVSVSVGGGELCFAVLGLQPDSGEQVRAELLQQHLQLINQHVFIWITAVHVLLEGQHERAGVHKLLSDPAR